VSGNRHSDRRGASIFISPQLFIPMIYGRPRRDGAESAAAIAVPPFVVS
jgi:hypothetical protein